MPDFIAAGETGDANAGLSMVNAVVAANAVNVATMRPRTVGKTRIALLSVGAISTT
jgi:hypothetical protein